MENFLTTLNKPNQQPPSPSCTPYSLETIFSNQHNTTKQNSSKPILYWGSGSPYCWRVHIALIEKGIEFESKCLCLQKREHKTEQYLKMNPRGEVPTFVDGDFVVKDSMAILDYIEQKWTDKPLLPKDLKERSIAVQRTFDILNNFLLSQTSKCVVMLLFKPVEEWNIACLVPKYDAMMKEFAILDSYLEKSEFAGGKMFTFADCVLIPMLGTAARLGFVYEGRFKNLDRYYKQMLKRESVIKSWPPHWHLCKGCDKFQQLEKKILEYKKQHPHSVSKKRKLDCAVQAALHSPCGGIQ